RLRRRSIRVRVAAERPVPLVDLLDTVQAVQPERPVRVEPAPVAAAPAVQRVAPPPARPAVNNARPAPSAGRTGRPSTLALLQRLSDEDPMRRVTALREAIALPDADRIMIRALSDEYPMVRREAVRVLGEMATQEATKALTDVAAHDTSSEVREEAIAALAAVIRRRK